MFGWREMTWKRLNNYLIKVVAINLWIEWIYCRQVMDLDWFAYKQFESLNTSRITHMQVLDGRRYLYAVLCLKVFLLEFDDKFKISWSDEPKSAHNIPIQTKYYQTKCVYYCFFTPSNLKTYYFVFHYKVNTIFW